MDLLKDLEMEELCYRQGTNTTIYKALDKEQNVKYIVKQIDLTNLSEKRINNAMYEAEFHQKHIQHPNLVKYIGSYRDKDQLIIILEYANRGDLAAFITQKAYNNEVLEENMIWYILICGMDALRYLHKNNVAHRDIKPDNFFLHEVEGRLQLKIGDLGFGKDLQKQLVTMVGAWECRAPEMYSQSSYSVEVDYWAMGIVLYVMLAFQFPFMRNANTSKEEQRIKLSIMQKELPEIETEFEQLKWIMKQLTIKDFKKRMNSQQFFQLDVVKEKIKQIQGEFDVGHLVE
uniref:Kinase, NEK n=1 Tax=Trepomonas sp. PC1 TaxID=1076344 RepID=A0A146KFW1_9EUKA|eukprot:JAP94301.1 Kinase, NEK [Trepomonas sp. PC1]